MYGPPPPPPPLLYRARNTWKEAIKSFARARREAREGASAGLNVTRGIGRGSEIVGRLVVRRSFFRNFSFRIRIDVFETGKFPALVI